MSVSNQFFSEKLIYDYVKGPPTLKELTNTRIAIQLCQHSKLKKRIFDSQYIIRWIFLEWGRRIGAQSANLCETLALPPALKVPLINRIWLIANRMFSWKREHNKNLSTKYRHTADQFLAHSDWTDEGRINEENIAKRLVQDERIPVSERYRIACVNMLESYITLLWDQIPSEHRKELVDAHYYDIYQQSYLVRRWSYSMEGRRENYLRRDNVFWKTGLLEAVKEGRRTAVVYCWNALNENIRQEVIVGIAQHAWTQYCCVRHRVRNPSNGCIVHVRCSAIWCGTPIDYSDMLYFLVSQMSDEQVVQFFQSLYESAHPSNTDVPVVVYTWLIESPHQRYFITIIAKLWDILPEKHYVELLRELLVIHENIGSKEEYKDFNYRNLLIDLLERTPEKYYRYIFANPDKLDEFFGVICNQKRNIDIVENILHRATVEEMRSLMYSSFGKDFCYCLIKCGSRERLNLILRDYLPEKEIADFKKKFLLSYRGRELLFWILANENGECLKSLLKWGNLSDEEISDFKPKLIWEGLMWYGKSINSFAHHYLHMNERHIPQWNPIDAFTCLLEMFDVESVDKVLEWCLPCKGARKQYKDQLVSILRNGTFRFCESILSSEFNLKRTMIKISQLCFWAFPSEVDRKHFKQKLFTEGYPCRILRKSILHEQWQDADAFIELFELSPEDIKQLKENLVWAADTQYIIFDLLYKSDSETVSHYLDWGLSDSKNLKAFIDRFDGFILEDTDRVKRHWNQLIKYKFDHLAALRPDEKRNVGKFVEE